MQHNFPFPKKYLRLSRNAGSHENSSNRQIRQVDFALTNFTEIGQNRQIHEQSLGLTKFRQLCHFRYYVHF